MAVRRLLSAVTAASVVLAMYGLPAPATEAGAEDGGAFNRITGAGIHQFASISTEDTPSITPERLPGSPWDHFGLQLLVGTLGAAGGGVVGGLLGTVLCLLLEQPSPVCPGGILVGAAIGTVVAPVIAVDVVGRAFGIRGNTPMAFLMTVGGIVSGGFLDLRLRTLPLFFFLGGGFGAALGYNIGATMVPQPPAGRREKIEFAQVTIRW